ncbi:MAG: DNA methyltransferase, partial [Verrucomicrobia bacterium]|nr:DNA methyltransferase [Verrucomicrobiota bacterium]
RVRGVLDEVFGQDNFVSAIVFSKTGSLVSDELSNVSDYLLLYAKSRDQHKFRAILVSKEELGIADSYSWIESLDLSRRGLNAAEKRDRKEVPAGVRYYQPTSLISSGAAGGDGSPAFRFEGKDYSVPSNSHWKTTIEGLAKLAIAHRIASTTNSLRYVRYLDDYPVAPISNMWTGLGAGSFTEDQIYVVQTSPKVIQRCMLMVTDPGDLVLDPTCGSGTTAYVAEQWGRRWITMDTSRVALALARARIMGARYPYYLLADSREGQIKEAEVTKTLPSEQPTHGNIRHGFVYERVPHITLKSIANNAEIDVIWEQSQKTLEPLQDQLNKALKQKWEEWQIPRAAETDWPKAAKDVHARFWQARAARQKDIDASIAAKAEFEYLYDKPYDDKTKVRVAGPFTVESVSPHRVLTVDENDNVVDGWKVSEGKGKSGFAGTPDFASVILENLRLAGVQQAHKEDRITFTSLVGWPGKYIGAEGRYLEGKGDNAPQKRAAILIGPEFGTVSRPDLVAAAREAADANFDVLIACAFNYDAHSAEFEKLGRIPVLKARMNPDLHMADELKNTGAGNLFVVFGEPDIDIEPVGKDQVRVQVKGVDVFKPQTGEVVSAGPEGIACWFIDTDYNEESFFVRHAYFLGANDPYQSLKTTLKAEIDQEAWESLHSAVSRPFAKPTTGRIAVKVINHLGDEVMKVFPVHSPSERV